MLFSALHGREAARVLALEGFGARAEERDEEIFANQGAEGYGSTPNTSGNFPAGQRTWIKPRCHCASRGSKRCPIGS